MVDWIFQKKNEFAVDPACRGQGIGKMLTNLSVDAELGITKLLADGDPNVDIQIMEERT